uniref:BTB domain-containing protein n=1 Tax=Cyprinus carpio TaxID=7962 RepID=A0A8C1LIZ8_CYPCA
MWQYRHPDFAVFLLGELQKQQQQGSIFCDTLLQTDGVCVPAHSCVLAALSPVLSRVFSTSPAPQAGQNRLLSLEAVGSHALLKIVKFLYTGEMESKSQSEHEEVMAAAFRLGLKNLFEKKRVYVERGVEDVVRHWREIGVQTEDVNSQEGEIVSEPLRIQSSTLPVQACGLLEADLSSLSLLDEASPTTAFNRTSNATIPSLAVMTEASVINHQKTKAKKRWKMAKRESQLKKLTRQQMNVSGKNFQKLLEADNRQKSATAEQKEAKLDQLKVRIKLRRSGACWESNLLVSVQGENEKNPEELKECGLQTQSCPPSVLPGQSLGILTPSTDLPISPSYSSTHASSDKCLHTPHHISVSSPLEIPTLSSSPPEADESDEHIAKMLDDMLMDLNILPLMPIDRSLDEQEQLGPLQDPKGQQRAAAASAQGACVYMQSCEPEMRGSDVSKTAAPVGSPGQRDEDHSGFQNQSRSNTFVTQSPGPDHLNKEKNLAAGARNSTPSLVEDLFLTPKATGVPANPSPAAGEMSSLGMISILDDRPEFKLLRCLSPLESDKGDSDVPTQEISHRQDLEMQNLPLWLSESPLKLDFPLSSMIDSSYPHPQPDLIACQNRSCPDLAEMQELKSSFLQDDLMSGSSPNTIRRDVKDASEHPKQRKTRRQRLATQKSEVNGDTKFENLENQDQVQPRISKCDDPHCEDVKPSTSNARRVSTRITNANRKAAAGVKRKKDISSPISKKRPLLNTDSEQPKYTGIVKRGRGRPPRSKNAAVAHMRNSAEKLPTSAQDDCEVEKTKKDGEMEQGNKQQPNTQQEKDSTEMEEADANSNFAQTTLNSHFKYANQAKGTSIIDQIFHQPLPSVESLACRSSLNTDQPLTSSLRDTSFSLQKIQGGKSEDESSKLMMNSSEVLNKGICGKKKAEMSLLINKNKDREVSDNQVGSPLSCGDMLDNVKRSENSSRQASVVQNSDSQNEMGRDIPDQKTEISVPLTTEEDIMKEIMIPAVDIDIADHARSPTEKDCDVSTNELTVMERIEVNFCMNPDSTPAEHLRDEQNLEDTASNECSFGATSHMDKDVQEAHEETMEGEETEALGANELVEASSDDRCWDDDEVNEEGDQCSAGKTDEQTLQEEDELSKGHIAGAGIADDASNRALTLRETEEIISRDAPSVQSNYQSPRVCSENISALTSSSESSDEEDIEVDVVDESVDDPLGLLAARQFVTLAIECLMEQEDELDATEEEEVDVTGGETE